VDQAALAQLEHVNLVEAFCLFGGSPEGAKVIRADGVAIVSSGLPFILFNQVLVETPDATDAAVAAGVDLLRRRGVPFVLNLRVGADDRFVALADRLGLVPVSERPWLPGMAIHPVPRDPEPQAPGFLIRQASDRAGLDDHIRTAAAGFGMDEETIRAVVVDRLLARDDVAIYVGYADGVPVATGAGVRTDRAIGVYNIATVESAQRRGFGRAMTRRVLDDGAAAGSEVGILQSSDAGLALYERLGFRTVVEYAGYTEPSASALSG
jgi:ribosomal protein S18 acetylase RimI-like enzyme